jgi:hypothetical protein
MIAAVIFSAGIIVGVAAGIIWALREPATKAEAPEHVPTAIGLGDQNNIGIGSVDADRLRAILKHVDSRTLYEIKRQ